MILLDDESDFVFHDDDTTFFYHSCISDTDPNEKWSVVLSLSTFKIFLNVLKTNCYRRCQMKKIRGRG